MTKEPSFSSLGEILLRRYVQDFRKQMTSMSPFLSMRPVTPNAIWCPNCTGSFRIQGEGAFFEGSAPAAVCPDCVDTHRMSMPFEEIWGLWA